MSVTWRCPHCGHQMQRVSASEDPLIGAGIGVSPSATIHCTRCYQDVRAMDVINGKYDDASADGAACGCILLAIVAIGFGLYWAKPDWLGFQGGDDDQPREPAAVGEEEPGGEEEGGE